MILLYLDTCSLQRPLDDRTQARIALEAEAILAILALCELPNAPVQLVTSEVIAFEVAQNPQPERRIFADAVLTRALTTVGITESIIARAKLLEQEGVPAIDALHLAADEAAPASFFCTCDDRFYRRAKTLARPPTIVVTPLERAQELLP